VKNITTAKLEIRLKYFWSFPLEDCLEFGHFVITLIICNEKKCTKEEREPR
jgi:hypothetical protein